MLKDNLVAHRVHIFAGLALAGLLVVALLPARFVSPVTAQQGTGLTPDIVVIPPGFAYRQTNFVSDVGGLAFSQDPLLVNPWGIAQLPTSPFWTSNNASSTATIYTGDVSGSPLVKNNALEVTIPGGRPTGVVSNSGSDFVITSGGGTSAARFIFASITGNIVGWRAGSAASIQASHAGRVYTGLAIGSNSGGNRLYAADFANIKIDVYDGTFALTTVSGGFVDPTIPVGFAPHNIQNLGGTFPLYVTYAKINPIDGTALNGPGNGYVRRFDTDGVRDPTFAINTGTLDAPWGVAIAPGSFGTFGGALLVGNFSDAGRINAFRATDGLFLGTLQNEGGQPIGIDGLWALQFGNGVGGDTGTLYFTAGIAKETHGLFGSLKPTTSSATSLVQFSTNDFVVGEAGGHIDVTVVRFGDVSGTATVNVSTYDVPVAGHASEKSDYETALAKVTFNPGDTSKTVRILVINDNFVDGDEIINLQLSNPTGAGVGLGSPNAATLKIIDNDAIAPTTNPVDDPSFFVRQQYLDFLNREPDTAGQAFWTNEITSCAGNAACIEVKRINVSAAFFLSNEFQRTGMLAFLSNKAAFGNRPTGAPVPVLYGEFEKETQQLQKDLVFGQPNFDAQLEANKQAYFNDFVTRPEFVAKFSALTDTAYVDSLLASAGIDPPNVRLFTATLTNSQEVPPTVPTLSGGGARPASSGTAKFTFNAAQTAMTFTATINNIDVGGTQTADTNDNLLNAHIHAGPTVVPGVNGPVVWGFFGAPFNDNNPNDGVTTPFATGVGGNFSGKWDAPEGNATTLAAQLTNLRTGHAYINFHTTQFGGGEIRGNFPAEDAFRNSLIAGLTGATLTRAQVLRAVAESEEFSSNEFNRAFVLMQYFGYMRRDPDAGGYSFWLTKLNAFNGSFVNAEMVKAFINSSEYRQRFGP